jgi:hypothetical protein
MKTTSLQQQPNGVLTDLKTTYLDLVGDKLWVGITAPPHGSTFVAGTNNNDEVNQTHAMAAMKNLPWDEWVEKYAKCHHCGGQGHIRPHCPIYIEKVK